MQVALPPQLNASTLRSVMKEWPVLPEQVDLVFNERQWATPTGMVGLACLIENLIKSGGRVIVHAGTCETVSYWDRMGFFREVGLPSPASRCGIPRNPNGRFAEMRRVHDIDHVDALTQELVSVTNPPEESLKTFSHILSEAMNNVCQHSGAYGFSAAQYWTKTGREEFCIADRGAGLFSALQHAYSPADDTDAMRLALQVGVTSRSPTFNQPHMRNRGVGLSCIERLVNANGGRFELWSGHARFTSGDEGPSAIQNPWTGTLITVNMLRDRLTADFHTVMRQLTEELRLVERAGRRLS